MTTSTSPDEADGDPRVTGIRRGSRGRAVLTTSDGETLIVHAEALALARVREGDALDGAARERLDLEQHRRKAHEAALRLLRHRPRSEREMVRRLRQRGLPADVVAEEVERLREAGLLDDEAFAESWVEERRERSPRGKRLLRQELQQRGVGAAIADEAVSAVDDRTAALAVARGRVWRLEGLDFQRFSQRLAGFLQRRGFGYEVVEEAVRTVWNENAPEGERR